MTNMLYYMHVTWDMDMDGNQNEETQKNYL